MIGAVSCRSASDPKSVLHAGIRNTQKLPFTLHFIFGLREADSKSSPVGALLIKADLDHDYFLAIVGGFSGGGGRPAIQLSKRRPRRTQLRIVFRSR